MIADFALPTVLIGILIFGLGLMSIVIILGGIAHRLDVKRDQKKSSP